MITRIAAPADLRVGILGPLEVLAGPATITVGGARLRMLLTRLALDVGRVVSADALAEAVWPSGTGPTDRVNALQSLVSRLRRTLPNDRLRLEIGGYLLDLPSDAVDAHRFENLATEGRRAVTNGRPESALRLLDEARSLLRGEFPSEVPDYARQRLEELRLQAAEDRADAAITVGRRDGVAAEIAQLAAAHPFRERLHALHIRALQADGRRAEALVAFEQIRAVLADELGADPGQELHAAHLAAVRGAGPSARPRGNLRAALTSFVGRDAELARLRELLENSRLVTLTGPGGVGKTRLALAIAAETTTGAWLVELAAVHSPQEVVRAATSALGIGASGLLEPPPDPIERLVDALARADAVLVLDNCEHLIDEATRLAVELLSRCPRLRIIATSREPLGLAGEHVCPVSPLPLDAATRLFADRAHAVHRDFELDADMMAKVEQVCSKLDRLPLAIELAAARLHAVPLQELTVRLDAGFALLARADRAAEPRHRTLRAVVAWSWKLLDAEDRAAAQRLAVFHGVISVDSAAAVAGAGLDRLAPLTDKSLLQFDGQRYRMLETVRNFALEELTVAGELATARTAHAHFFLALAEQAEPHLRGCGQRPWVARLESERDNFSAALRYARDAGDADTAVRLCAALGMFWLIRGDQQAMTHWPRTALAIPGKASEQARAATIALDLLATGIWIGRDVDRNVMADLARSAATHPLITLIEPCLAYAGQHVDAGLAVINRRSPHPDGWTEAILRLMRGMLHGSAGNLAATRSDLEAAHSGFRAVGDRAGLSWSLTALADLRATFGEFDRAIEDLTEAVRLMDELDPTDTAVLHRARIAALQARMGDTDRARADLEQLLRTAGMPGAGDYLAFAHLTLASLARDAGDRAEATYQVRLAADGLDGTLCVAPLYRVSLDCARADLAMDVGDIATARQHLAAAFEQAATTADGPLAGLVAARLARWRSLAADTAGAAELVGTAHALVGALDARNSDLVRLALTLRDTLGEHHYAEAYARGLDRDTAIIRIAAQLRTVVV
ncbi:BTAD domain-containing putative transcriptional regulator [Nocardia sp. GCM10030253]|uniref:BTAD domain-containing putative transcriptional regulator n=1 Tax=Nocardia sp. GCM10030253 TaxID=3273404 RepID=UPI003638CA27